MSMYSGSQRSLHYNGQKRNEHEEDDDLRTYIPLMCHFF